MLSEFIASTRQNVTAWCVLCTLVNAVYMKYIITWAGIAMQVFDNNALIKQILALSIMQALHMSGNFLMISLYDGFWDAYDWNFSIFSQKILEFYIKLISLLNEKNNPTLHVGKNHYIHVDTIWYNYVILYTFLK